MNFFNSHSPYTSSLFQPYQTSFQLNSATAAAAAAASAINGLHSPFIDSHHLSAYESSGLFGSLTSTPPQIHANYDLKSNQSLLQPNLNSTGLSDENDAMNAAAAAAAYNAVSASFAGKLASMDKFCKFLTSNLFYFNSLL